MLAVCGLLLLAAGLVFGQTVRHGFVNYDDDQTVYSNLQVTHGLTAQGVAWAFTHRHYGNWIPLTCLSHMLDCGIYGLNAAGHHLTNVLLHAATAVLLFLMLCQMTGRLWPSALAAALFAVHPLRVESVAWVTERKDVLSGLFFMLTLAAYVDYVRHRPSLLRYLAVTAFFAMGLMAKPMLVTLPAVLLLLDYWPLGRFAGDPRLNRKPLHGNEGTSFNGANVDANSLPAVPRRFPFPWRIVIEKLPLLLLVVVSCAATLTQGEALAANEQYPLSWRIGNVPISYVTYLRQSLCPMNLALLYPRLSLALPLWQVFAAVLSLAGITAATFVWRRRRPYLLVGWLWYLGMLVPVLGVVQVGSQAVADRFTYLPQIGLWIALAWGAADVWRSAPYGRWLCGSAAALVLAVLMGCAWRQTTFWRNSETQWTHTLACTSRNAVAHNGLGLALADRGRLDEAMAQYQTAMDISPDLAEVPNNLGNALTGLNRLDEAIAQYQKSLTIRPDYAEAHNNLGNRLVHLHRLDEAMAHYRKALELKPDFIEAHNNLGNALADRGRLAEAMAHYQTALEIKPDYAEAHNNLGNALVRLNRINKAIAHYQKALEIEPDYADAHNNLGLALVRLNRIDEAIAHYQKAAKIKPDFAEAHGNLGNALAGRGRLDEAIAQYQQAVKLKPDYAEAHNNLGIVLAGRGRLNEAIAQYQKAAEIKPDFAEAYGNLGNALADLGQLDEAIAQYQQAVRLKPDYAEAHNNLGIVLAGRGRLNEAIAQYQKAAEIKPDFAEAHGNLGNALADRGRLDEAIAQYQKAVKIKPGYAEAHYNFAIALTDRGRFDEAIAQFQRALEIQPDDADAHNKLAWLRATCPKPSLRSGTAAIEHAQRANGLCGGRRPDVLDTLAAAYAEAGRFPEALRAARHALDLATQQHDQPLADVLRSRIRLYEAGKPYRSTLSTFPPLPPKP
jgi:tetratricopeptide (TPR) repeat protein